MGCPVRRRYQSVGLSQSRGDEKYGGSFRCCSLLSGEGSSSDRLMCCRPYIGRQEEESDGSFSLDCAVTVGLGQKRAFVLLKWAMFEARLLRE